MWVRAPPGPMHLGLKQNLRAPSYTSTPPLGLRGLFWGGLYTLKAQFLFQSQPLG